MSLGGVTAVVAQKIIDYRQQHGQFGDIFDIYKVPGLGRRTFRRITGMPYSSKKRHRVEKLARLLGMPADQVYHLPKVVAALARSKGISGVVVSDREGLVTGEQNVGDFAESLAAVAPSIVKSIQKSMSAIGRKRASSISMSVDRRMLTIAACGEYYLTVVHESNRIAATQLSMIQAVARELAWVLSRVGYVA
jgi:predicted regulator of Ras-like GTPase activity (Roadblock/LC7/MglB family)